MNAKGAFAFAVCSVAFGLLLYTLNMHSYPTPVSNPGDFRAFYCAGRAVDAGRDPYLTEPLRSCERGAAADFGMAFGAADLIPAPLPPYAFALFAPLGLEPFSVASNCWFVVSCTALLLAIFATWRLSGASLPAIASALFVAGGLVSFGEGQVAPLATASLVLAALAMRVGRYAEAAVALSFTAIEPHVALPALVAAFAERRMRVPVVAICVVLIAFDLGFGGLALSKEYATSVLPLQAAAQIDHLYAQFSLSALLWGLGVSRSVAGLAGSLDYVAMLALGVWAALRLRERFDDRAMLVLVPPAFVVLGGTYVHLFLMVVALPLAFVCFTRVRHRGLVAAAIVVLALPPQFVVVRTPLRHVFYPRAVAAAHFVVVPDATTIPQAAEVRNGAANRPPDLATLARYCALKLPTWLALAALIVICVREALGATGPKSDVAARARPA